MLLPELPFPQLWRRDLLHDVNGSVLQGVSQKPFEEVLQSVPRDFQPQVFPCYLSQQQAAVMLIFLFRFPSGCSDKDTFLQCTTALVCKNSQVRSGDRCRTRVKGLPASVLRRSSQLLAFRCWDAQSLLQHLQCMHTGVQVFMQVP